jgi:hypothetical protein
MLAAGLAVTTLLAGGLASAASASVRGHDRPDATVACGSCYDFSSQLLGTGLIANAYVPGDTGSGGKVGQDVNLKYASNTHPNQDFTSDVIGTIGDLCGPASQGYLLGPTSYACLNFSSYPVFEADWSPYGAESGLCAGVAVAGLSGENVTLQSCGVSARTLWVADVPEIIIVGGAIAAPGSAISSASTSYFPLINVSDPDFSQPLVMTVDPGTVHPENQLILQTEVVLPGGAAQESQEFTSSPGPVS